MKRNKGFTLLELMIVVIVIGVLASLALPRFNRAVERGRQSEALSNLGTLRSSEFRYYSEFTAIQTDPALLDVEDPNTLPGRYFDYAITDDGGGAFTITATRNTLRRPAGVGAYTIQIDHEGTITTAGF